MNKIILYLTAIVLITCQSIALDVKIKGKIKDAADKKPLLSATVKLIATADSSIVSGTKSNGTGDFTIVSNDLNHHLLHITYIGYKDKIINLEDYAAKTTSIDLGDIMLDAEAFQAEAVEITAAKDIITTEVDKTVINVSKMPSTAGGTATEILKNIPQVRVDLDNNVSLRGNSNIKVLIDGKPSGIPPNELLQQIPSASIEKIELITNPSAKYDPEGSAGIINIITKKEKIGGLAGMLNLNAGNEGRYNGMLNLNYKGKGYNLYGGYSGHIFKHNGDFSSEVMYLDTLNPVPYRSESGHYDRSYIGQSINLGADYSFDDNFLSLKTSYNLSKREREDNNVSRSFLRDSSFFEHFSRNYTSDNQNNSYDINAAYSHSFIPHKKELSMNLYYGPYNNPPEDNITKQNYSKDGMPFPLQEKIKVKEDSKYKYLSFDTDFFNFLTDKRKYEAGIKMFYRNNKNDYKYLQFNNQTSVWDVNTSKSNDFDYEELVSGGYVTYLDAVGDFGYQLGLRGEYTYTKGNQKTLNIINKNDYFSLFPSINLKYNISEFLNIGLNYSRRISRPYYKQVNPFVYYQEEYALEAGNPDLKPEFSNNFELSQNLFTDKLMLNSSIYYNVSTDNIQNLFFKLADNKYMSKPVNTDEIKNWGASLYSSYQFTKWWKTDASISYYSIIYTKGDAEKYKLPESSSNYYIWINNELKFWNFLSWQAYLWYSGPSRWGQYENKAQYQLYTGFRADFKLFGNDAAINLSINGLLRNQSYDGTIQTNDMISKSVWEMPSKYIFLGFSYKFNGYRQTYLDSKGGSGEEKIK